MDVAQSGALIFPVNVLGEVIVEVVRSRDENVAIGLNLIIERRRTSIPVQNTTDVYSAFEQVGKIDRNHAGHFATTGKAG